MLIGWPKIDWEDRRVLLAVSGGADSVALLRAMHRLKTGGDGQLLIAHFNHQLRGAASDADERFVVELAGELGVSVTVREHASAISTPAADEESLRNARYQFLQQTAEQLGARYVATAHTADDQVETVLHRILRGTGVAGLSGIPRTRSLGDAVVILRPMLGITRTEVLEYLRSLGQPYCEDASNQNADYTRNRIRHELLPQLAKDFNPAVRESILRLSQLASESQGIVDQLVEELLEDRVQFLSPTNVSVDCSRFGVANQSLVRALLTALWRRQSWPLADMGYREWDRLAEFSVSEHPQSIELPGAVRAHKKGESLLLTRPS